MRRIPIGRNKKEILNSLILCVRARTILDGGTSLPQTSYVTCILQQKITNTPRSRKMPAYPDLDVRSVANKYIYMHMIISSTSFRGTLG